MNLLDLNIALVRSCATDWDNQDRLTGTLDVPLCKNGRDTALQIADKLKLFSFAAIVSARCLAARQTAEIVAAELGLRVRPDSNLVNLDLGLWQGKQVDELKNCQPKQLRNWQEAPDLVAPPHGETTETVRARVQKSLKRWSRKFRGQQIVLVAPEPLASIIKSEVQQDPIAEFKHLSNRCGRWEWIRPTAAVAHAMK